MGTRDALRGVYISIIYLAIIDNNMKEGGNQKLYRKQRVEGARQVLDDHENVVCET